MRTNPHSNYHLVYLPGLVHVTEEGDAPAPRHGTSAVLAHAPGSVRGGTAAGPAPAAEDTVTAGAASPAQNTSTELISAPFLTKTFSSLVLLF